MSMLRSRSPRAREKRIATMNAWLGTAGTAVGEFAGGEPEQRIRTFSQSAQDDLVLALRLLSGIRNSVVILHTPAGCAAAGLWHRLSPVGARLLVTNLDQKDTIMGADHKLRKAVTSAFCAYRPDVLFVVAGPVSAINNDDIQSVVVELSDELELPVIPVFTTGFASRSAVTGYDIALHAIVKHLAGTDRQGEGRNQTVNLLSVTEGEADRFEAVRILSALGVEINLLPAGAFDGDFSIATGARVSLPLDQDAANYLGAALEREYGVPYLDLPKPVGLRATGNWLVAAGAALGAEEAAWRFHEQQSAMITRELDSFSLEGRRVYLSLSPSGAFGIADLIGEFGGTVAGITVSHLDRVQTPLLEELASRHPGLQLHVADGQPFEELNIVRRISPDLYIGDGLHVGQMARLGIPVVSLEAAPYLGYTGVLSVARRIATALRNPSFVTVLARRGTPYREAWLTRSPNWHIKLEVK